MTALEHYPVTGWEVRIEEQDLFGCPGSNVRVRVLSDDGTRARIIVEDAGVHARQGQQHTVLLSALNGGRRSPATTRTCSAWSTTGSSSSTPPRGRSCGRRCPSTRTTLTSSHRVVGLALTARGREVTR